VLAVGVVATTAGVHTQRVMPLRAPLATAIPGTLAGWASQDIEVSEEEQRVAGMDSYVMRVHQPVGAAADSWFTVYVGYYESQAQGNTIHSPKNCLPGGGWEPLTSQRQAIATPLGEITVNRYLIANGAAKSLVLYWYQGRGRVEANEYTVKWDLLRDQALLGRSDEALVRVIVPVTTTEDAAYAQAEQVAKELVVHVDRALPARS
jgi:EpsI family protein